jgi:hypothetical protein
VSSSSGCCTAKQPLGNPGFETGSAAPWSATAGVINPNGAGETAHSGNWFQFTSSAIDTLKVQALNSSGTVVATPATCSNVNANNAYVQKSLNVRRQPGWLRRALPGVSQT